MGAITDPATQENKTQHEAFCLSYEGTICICLYYFHLHQERPAGTANILKHAHRDQRLPGLCLLLVSMSLIYYRYQNGLMWNSTVDGQPEQFNHVLWVLTCTLAQEDWNQIRTLNFYLLDSSVA